MAPHRLAAHCCCHPHRAGLVVHVCAFRHRGRAQYPLVGWPAPPGHLHCPCHRRRRRVCVCGRVEAVVLCRPRGQRQLGGAHVMGLPARGTCHAHHVGHYVCVLCRIRPLLVSSRPHQFRNIHRNGNSHRLHIGDDSPLCDCGDLAQPLRDEARTLLRVLPNQWLRPLVQQPQAGDDNGACAAHRDGPGGVDQEGPRRALLRGCLSVRYDPPAACPRRVGAVPACAGGTHDLGRDETRAADELSADPARQPPLSDVLRYLRGISHLKRRQHRHDLHRVGSR
mmetsp:Transcript_26297/g.77097  ORF Transcript_26297/g.77097 Transcript_26297/m.77097 type:complete len:281 (-) Transcript_26297:1225-2067(-)